jgi:hypothetical protein
MPTDITCGFPTSIQENAKKSLFKEATTSGVPGSSFGGGGLRQEFFFCGGVQQIQLTKDRENGDLRAVAP